MRTLAVPAIAVVWGLLAVSTAAATQQGAQKPLLTLTVRDPMTVRGVGFGPGERVRVTLLQPGSVRVVRAGRRGGFVVTFDRATHRCDLVRVIAVGGGGAQAALKILPSPACLIDRLPDAPAGGKFGGAANG